MAVLDLYSKRKKRELSEANDVYIYDNIPVELRRQIIHIWGDAFGKPNSDNLRVGATEEIQNLYLNVAQALRREYGLFTLTKIRIDPEDRREAREDLISWFLSEDNVDRALDAIELTFRVIDRVCSHPSYLNRHKNREIANRAIEELNSRFKEHGVGYQLSDGDIIRVDSLLLHSKAVVPALVLLRQSEYGNAQTEFLGAYEHYRHGNKAEALVECVKSFESTMKVICDQRGWTHSPNATAKELIQVCYDNGLIPPYWQTHFSGLRSVLESGIPTPRNRQGGHGAGAGQPQEIPDHLVAYVLHMTASTILFLVEAKKKLP